MQCDAMRCDAMRCDAMRCDAMRCDAVSCAALRCGAVRCDAMRCDAMRCDAMLCCNAAEFTTKCLWSKFMSVVFAYNYIGTLPWHIFVLTCIMHYLVS